MSGTLAVHDGCVLLSDGTGRAFVQHGCGDSFLDIEALRGSFFHYAIDDTARAIRP
jgi:hypothetical protein